MIIVVGGAPKTGKSQIVLSLAKILANSGKRVCIADFTKSQGMYYYFNFNLDVEIKLPIMRENIEIYVNDPINNSHDTIKSIEEVAEANFEYILIEVDCVLEHKLIDKMGMFILVQDFDKGSLLYNNKLLGDYRRKYSSLNTVLVLNNYIKCKLTEDFIKQQLKLEKVPCFVLPLTEYDLSVWSGSRMDGRINLSKYSGYRREEVFRIACNITQLDKRAFRKLVR